MAFDIKLLNELTAAFGPSGRENRVADIITEKLKAMKLSPKRDAHGSVRVSLSGSGKKKVLLAAHMDEIGVITTFVDKRGFFKFAPVGGLMPENLISSRVEFENGVRGIICSEKKKKNEKVAISDLYVDTGATDKDTAIEELPLGSFGVFTGELYQQGKDRIVSKALDDRIGVYVLLKVIDKLKNASLKDTLHFVFTVQEEFTGLGAATTAFGINPTIGVAVDVTDSDDTREKKDLNMRLGDGPAVKIMDSSLISHPGLKDYLISTAKKKKIPYQLEVLPFGGTDAGTISLVKKGIPSICVSIPTRYIHSPSEMISKKDVEETVKLLAEALKGKMSGAL